MLYVARLQYQGAKHSKHFRQSLIKQFSVEEIRNLIVKDFQKFFVFWVTKFDVKMVILLWTHLKSIRKKNEEIYFSLTESVDYKKQFQSKQKQHRGSSTSESFPTSTTPVNFVFYFSISAYLELQAHSRKT